MNESKSARKLPENYFDAKDGMGYRFTILKDIAIAGDKDARLYDESDRESIFRYYDQFEDFTLYVHFPWCVEHCSYCHYYRGPVLKRNELSSMLAAERKHAKMFDDAIDLPNRKIRSIYYGGGTPTVLPTEMMEDAMTFYVDRYNGKSEDCEVCVECSPMTLKLPKKIDILERFTDRLSLGVQSFDDEILQVVERKHKSAQAQELLKELIPRFPSVNIDLIYGLHQQSLDSWLKGVQTSIDLKAQSLTLYRLDIREIPRIIRAYKDNPSMFPTEFECWRMYEDAKKMLLDAGYRENLVGWFLLPEVKDTQVYRERWEKQSPCIALGPALHNYAENHFYETIAKHEDYIAAVEAGKLPIHHTCDMNPKRRAVWYVLAQLKSGSPFYKSVLRDRYGRELQDWLMDTLKNYVHWGVLIDSGDKVELNDYYNYILEWMLVELIGSIA